jgi:hypothetical protein
MADPVTLDFSKAQPIAPPVPMDLAYGPSNFTPSPRAVTPAGLSFGVEDAVPQTAAPPSNAGVTLDFSKAQPIQGQPEGFWKSVSERLQYPDLSSSSMVGGRGELQPQPQYAPGSIPPLTAAQTEATIPDEMKQSLKDAFSSVVDTAKHPSQLLPALSTIKDALTPKEFEQILQKNYKGAAGTALVDLINLGIGVGVSPEAVPAAVAAAPAAAAPMASAAVRAGAKATNVMLQKAPGTTGAALGAAAGAATGLPGAAEIAGAGGYALGRELLPQLRVPGEQFRFRSELPPPIETPTTPPTAPRMPPTAGQAPTLPTRPAGVPMTQEEFQAQQAAKRAALRATPPAAPAVPETPATAPAAAPPEPAKPPVSDDEVARILGRKNANEAMNELGADEFRKAADNINASVAAKQTVDAAIPPTGDTAALNKLTQSKVAFSLAKNDPAAAQAALDAAKAQVQPEAAAAAPEKTPEITVHPERILNSHHGQQDAVIYATTGPEQLVQGKLEYSHYGGEIHVNNIEVAPDMQRQGIATQMWGQLKSENPGVKINPGYATGEGAAFLQSVGQEKPTTFKEALAGSQAPPAPAPPAEAPVAPTPPEVATPGARPPRSAYPSRNWVAQNIYHFKDVDDAIETLGKGVWDEHIDRYYSAIDRGRQADVTVNTVPETDQVRLRDRGYSQDAIDQLDYAGAQKILRARKK